MGQTKKSKPGNEVHRETQANVRRYPKTQKPLRTVHRSGHTHRDMDTRNPKLRSTRGNGGATTPEAKDRGTMDHVPLVYRARNKEQYQKNHKPAV